MRSDTKYFPVTTRVRRRVERGGDRVWRFDDFADLPTQAVAQALSRLSRSGELRRLSKGVYYRPRKTAFGESRPNLASMQITVTNDQPIFPSGVAAAGMLGFTTQNPARREVATTALSLPRKFLGKDVIVHTRRPAAWSKLQPKDAALLDFLRSRGETSELSPQETVARLLHLLEEPGRYQLLLRVAKSEPPRVRAMLGALGEQLEEPSKELDGLRQSLNPLSRFDFGMLSVLPNARRWQAKGSRVI